jgi:endonuclease YncB( thermonuclease family)
MRSLVMVLVLLSAAAARGGDATVTAVGKVVAVEDGGSVWIYLPDACASYHISLNGVAAPPLTQPLGQTARSSLAKLVLGREVLVRVDRLNTVGLTGGEVFLEGRSVNSQLAAMIAGPAVAKSEPPVYSVPARRPLMTLCALIRSRWSWRN